MEGSAPSPVRIIVVEDNPNDQELLHHQLRKTPLGDHVLFFSDPRKALTVLQNPGSARMRRSLVGIFLDVNLPYMSGIDLLRHIRLIEDMKHAPVIVMTSDPRPEIRDACKELKVAFFAEKPVTLTQFSKVLADIFQDPEPVSA